MADTSNSRVLEYNTPLTNTTADMVFGQGGDFTSNVCNFDINLLSNGIDGSSANDLCSPARSCSGPVAHNLFVAETELVTTAAC